MGNLGGLRLIVAALGVAAVGALIVGAGQPGQDDAPARLGEVSSPRSGVAETIAPSPELSPEEVVTYQVTALRSNGRGERGIRQCYQFASPLNRAATGPLGPFVQMVRSPPYHVMLQAAEMLVGRAVIREDRATVLVTMIDAGRNIRVFRFFLSKQRELPYAGCWMTDAVMLEGPAPPRGRASAPAMGV